MNSNTHQTDNQPLVVASQSGLSMSDGAAFDHIQRVAKCFSESALVPAVFQKNIPNTVIALEMAHRIGASPLAVMQNLYIVHGKPSWASQFIIACINTCGRFEPLMFEVSGVGDNRQCIAWTTPRGTKLPPREDLKQWTVDLAKEAGLVVLDGPPCSISISKAEGWFSKNGSKWQTMPDLMLRYRAATFFGRIYAPELLMGMKAYEEILDAGQVIDVTQAQPEVKFRNRSLAASPEQVASPESSAAPVVVAVCQPTTDTPTEATEKTEPKKRKTKEESSSQVIAAPSEPSPHDKLATEVAMFYAKEASADFTQVMATLARINKTWHESITAKSYADMTDEQLTRLSNGKFGIAREVKKDVEASK